MFGGLSPEVDLFFSSWASMRIAPKVLDILKVLSLTERFNKQLIDFVFADGAKIPRGFELMGCSAIGCGKKWLSFRKCKPVAHV